MACVQRKTWLLLSLRSDRNVPMEQTPCDILFPSAFLENPFAVPQDGGGETQSTWLSLQEEQLQDARESQDGRGCGGGENATCARTPFLGLRRLGANSSGRPGCRKGLLSHPSVSNSPTLGWWLLRGGPIADSG